MNTKLGWPLLKAAGIVFCLGLAAVTSSQGQVSSPPAYPPIIILSNSIPVVTIEATVPIATWGGSPGVFTVTRSGNPGLPLSVYYEISGTASNGVDYQTIGNWVQIPIGVTSAQVIISPKPELLATLRTVRLTLARSQLLVPLNGAPINVEPDVRIAVNYIIGTPDTAEVDIVAGPATNIPPTVNIVAPADGAVFFNAPLNIPIIACANDLLGTVKTVQFFAGTNSLGIVSNSPIILPPVASPMIPVPPMPPYRPLTLTWSNVPAGAYVLTAVATDSFGAASTSAPVNITVNAGPPPPPPNQPPVVRIISPSDGSVFHAPVNIPLSAFAADPDGSVATVAFYDGTNFLGDGSGISIVAAGGGATPAIRATNIYSLIWSNVSIGDHALIAVATDNSGASNISSTVNITVLPPPPPPPPTPPVVSIVALDPIAIESTNCWPWLTLAGAPPTWSNWTASSPVLRYLTNCGPKNALFAVRRLGSTNDDVTVNYNIGGTASNGVDYVALPGSATIPAGQCGTLIPLVPIDDGRTNVLKTVLLKLAPASGYTVGFPASAAAVIVDIPPFAPIPRPLPDKTFHVTANGPDGAWFHIEYTSDLLNWTPVCTNQVFNGSIDFVDADAPANQVRFYRAIEESGPPSQ